MSKEVKYTVSDDTNKLINVIAAFDSVGEMFIKAVGGIYINPDSTIEEYYELAGHARDFLLQCVSDSICSKLGGNANEI